jgi:hypothetical protein
VSLSCVYCRGDIPPGWLGGQFDASRYCPRSADFRHHIEHFDTATLSLGRRTPRTARQRLEALQGIEQANRDMHAHDPKMPDDLCGWNEYRRAGYELRMHELMNDSSRSRIPRPERTLVRLT